MTTEREDDGLNFSFLHSHLIDCSHLTHLTARSVGGSRNPSVLGKQADAPMNAVDSLRLALSGQYENFKVIKKGACFELSHGASSSFCGGSQK